MQEQVTRCNVVIRCERSLGTMGAVYGAHSRPAIAGLKCAPYPTNGVSRCRRGSFGALVLVGSIGLVGVLIFKTFSTLEESWTTWDYHYHNHFIILSLFVFLTITTHVFQR